MLNLLVCSCAILLQSTPVAEGAPVTDHGLRIGVSFPSRLSKAPLDGRMLLMISKDDSREPRFQIGGGSNSQQVSGVDVDGLEPESARPLPPAPT